VDLGSCGFVALSTIGGFWGADIIGGSGRGAAWLAHWSGGPGVAGSNPAVPTEVAVRRPIGRSQGGKLQSPELEAREGSVDPPEQVTDRVFTVPNLLSFTRLASVPVFVWLFIVDEPDAAFIVYGSMAWTDFFDGYLARRMNQVSVIGKLLDPLADRIFIVALAIAVVARESLPLWLAVAIIVRDILLLSAFPFVDKRAVQRIPVTFAGKTATAMLLFGLTLLAYSETTFIWASGADEVGLAFTIGGAILYWITAFQYAREALQRMKAVTR
jgi:cardiolipin synthase (CMP-forming)